MEKTIGDLMTPISIYPKLLSTHNFKDAIVALTSYTCREKNYHPLVIVYENNVPVGLVGFAEILKIIEPGYLKRKTYRGWSIDPWLIPVFWTGLFSKKCREVHKKLIKEFMQPINYEISTEDPLIKATYLMSRYNLEAMIVKKGERFAGIIHRNEIFSEIAGIIKKGVHAEPYTSVAY